MLTNNNHKNIMLFVSVLVLMAVSFFMFQYVYEKCQDSDYTKNKYCAAYDITIASVKGLGKFFEDHSGAITALATIVIAAFTGTLWRATGVQVKFTREALVADKRAFVFAEGLFSSWENGEKTGSYNWRFHPVWKNSGDTPTKNLVIHSHCEVRDALLPDEFDFSYETDKVGGGLLGPKVSAQGGQAPQRPEAAITPQDLIDAQEGRKFIYLWGWAKYNDVFPGTPRHVTRILLDHFHHWEPKFVYPRNIGPQSRKPRIHQQIHSQRKLRRR